MIREKQGRIQIGRAAAVSLLAAVLLSGCAASDAGHEDTAADTLAVVEPETEQPQQKEPHFIYYVKDSRLFRFNVNTASGEKVQPTPVLKDETFPATLFDYLDIMQAEDGSFSVLKLERNGDLSNTDVKLVAVSNKTEFSGSGAEAAVAAELVGNGNIWPLIQGNRLLLTETDQDHVQPMERETNLYSYKPGEEKKEILKDILDIYPTDVEESFFFSRIDGSGAGMELYSYKDGQEQLLLSGYDYAGVSFNPAVLYCTRPFEGGNGQSYYEMKGIGADKKVKDILTAGDCAVSYYLEPMRGNVYYNTSDGEGSSNMYYLAEGKRVLLTGGNPRIWDILQAPDWLGGSAVVLYSAESGDQLRFYAAVDGQSAELVIPGVREGWSCGDISSADKGKDCIYLTLTKYDDSLQPVESRIYQYQLKDHRVNQEPECVAQGQELYFEKEGNGGIFFVEAPDVLYYNGTRILDRYREGSILTAGNNGEEYFALRQGDEHVPELVRFTTAGSSKIFMKQVARCEAYAGGLVLLSDCSSDSPHAGTLTYYDGMQIRTIDENVSAFYQYDPAQSVRALPTGWDWGGP